MGLLDTMLETVQGVAAATFIAVGLGARPWRGGTSAALATRASLWLVSPRLDRAVDDWMKVR